MGLIAALITILLSSSGYCQSGGGNCFGSLGGCTGEYDFSYDCKTYATVGVDCDLDRSGSAEVTWYLDGIPMPGGKLSHQLVVFNIWRANSTSFVLWKMKIIGWCDFKVYNLTCSVNEASLSKSTYICATYGIREPSDFKPFRNSSTTLAPKIQRPNPGDNVSLVCEDTFDDLRWQYNYSVSWQSKLAGSWSDIEYSHGDVTCVVYNKTIVRSTLTIINVTGQLEYSCILTKTDNFNAANETLYYSIIPLVRETILTVHQIAGISASVCILLIIGSYAMWRFWVPLRSAIHHTCSAACRQSQRVAAYDVVVLFDEEGQVPADFVYDRLRKKLEDEWSYKLCLPGRDFQIGNDIGSTIVDVIDRSHQCLFVIDGSFFESRWCDAALQSSLRNHGKVLCLLLDDGGAQRQSRQSDCEKQLASLAKLGVVMTFTATEAKPSRFKAVLMPHYRWTRLKRRLPPNPYLYRSRKSPRTQDSQELPSSGAEVTPLENALPSGPI